jgi:hypothetical protein
MARQDQDCQSTEGTVTTDLWPSGAGVVDSFNSFPRTAVPTRSLPFPDVQPLFQHLPGRSAASLRRDEPASGEGDPMFFTELA